MKKIISLALILVFTTIGFGQTDTAESTAKAFYDAWKAKNNVKIAELAAPKIAKLSNLKQAPDKNNKFESCHLTDQIWYCTWRSTEIYEIGVSLELKKINGKFKVINLMEGEFEAM